MSIQGGVGGFLSGFNDTFWRGQDRTERNWQRQQALEQQKAMDEWRMDMANQQQAMREQAQAREEQMRKANVALAANPHLGRAYAGGLLSQDNAFKDGRYGDISQASPEMLRWAVDYQTPQAKRLTALDDYAAKKRIDAMFTKPTAPKRAFREMVGDKGPGVYLIDESTGRASYVGGAMPKDATSFTVNPDGTVSFEQGPGAGGGIGLTRGGEKSVDDMLLAGEKVLRNLDRIEQQFDPQFLTYGGKISAAGKGVADKLGLDMGQDGKNFLDEYSRFHASAIDNMNSYIKSVTGAQMSENEVSRLRKAMPDPGLNWLDGDGPTKFQAKLGQVRDIVSEQVAWAIYTKKHGLRPNVIGSEDIRGLQERDGEAIAKDLVSQGVTDPTEINNRVFEALREEYGVVF